jgi:methyl-accepting chemotaxis protein
MEQIQTFSTVRGRAALRDIFRELRYEKQVSGFTTLLTCWRLCTFEREAYRYSKRQVTIIHSLGLFRGTSLFLQEIVNRFYFSTINSLVYLGAAALLLIISAYRFTDKVDNRAVLAGVALEAFMLFILFVVMFFSPADDVESEASTDAESVGGNSGAGSYTDIRELITEVGEISADYAAFTERLDTVTSTLSGMISRQDELIGAVNEVARSVSLASTPQPEFIESMRQTNTALQAFQRNVHDLVDATHMLRREEIQRAVRVEVERMLANRVEQIP